MRSLFMLVVASSTWVVPVAVASAQERARPDVVFVMTDDQRAGTLSHMPALKRLVVSRGMTFRSAWAPNPMCCPSRVSYLTGTYSHTNGVWRNNGPDGGMEAFDDRTTLATWLDDAGYRTGLFGKYLNGYDDASIVPPGWDEWFAFLTRDGRTYYGYDASDGGERVSLPDDVYSTTDTNRRVVAFIRSTPPRRRLFAVWSPIAPHRPSVPEERYAGAPIDVAPWRPPNYNERDVSDKPRWLKIVGRLRAPERAAIDRARLDQYRTLLSVDDGIARIVRALRRTGRLSNSLIVFASDNGLMWGEHRLVGKNVPYRASSQVPMVMRFDALGTAGGSSVGPVLNIDVAPTVVDLAGLDAPIRFDGRSLVPVLDGSRRRVRTRFVVEHAEGGIAPAYCGARTKRELYVRYATGEEEYYRRDRWELRSAVRAARNKERVRRLRSYARAQCRPLPPGFSW
jgi:N-acetylglucosamine-6-sulfatase